ncbi:MAG: DUF3667 domain-containing protein [Phenylobacterium sp.]
MTSELEIAVADSLPHLSARRRKKAPPPSGACHNCGTELQGHFCHVCGQNADTHKRSIRHLIWEAVETTFELDGRLFRTVPALFFRPGTLARDYIDGRIVRHVPPFRTFLVALLIFIFAAEHATHEQTLQQQRQKAAHEALLATPQGRASESARIRKEAAAELASDLKEEAQDRDGDLKDKDANPARIQAFYARSAQKAQDRYARALARADRVAQGMPEETTVSADLVVNGKAKSQAWFNPGVKKAVANPDYYWTVVFNWAQRLAVILLPIVGLALALVYRKRKDVFLYDHLLVAMNLLSFTFLTNAAGLLLPTVAMPYWFGLVAIWTPINLFQTLRGAYGSSILGAILKTLVVWWITVLASLMLLTGLLVLAVAKV